MARLNTLVKDIRKMTDTELLEHVRQIRHAKYVERPAAAARKEKPLRQESNRAIMKVNRMFRDMTNADREQLIKLLEKE